MEYVSTRQPYGRLYVFTTLQGIHAHRTIIIPVGARDPGELGDRIGRHRGGASLAGLEEAVENVGKALRIINIVAWIPRISKQSQ